MKIYEIGTGYTPIPASMGAATEIVVEELTKTFIKNDIDVSIIDIKTAYRVENSLPIIEVPVPKCIIKTDVQLGLMHKIKRVLYSISLARVIKRLPKCKNGKTVLHFHNQYNLFFFLLLSSRKCLKQYKIIYTNHSYIWQDNWESIKNTVKKRYFQEIYCMKYADEVFVLNNVSEQNVIQHVGIDSNKVHLIDNGVNTDVYCVLNNRDELKKKNNLEGKTVFLQVGSVCDRKNQMHAIELLTPLMKKDESIVYCYAGGIIDSEYKNSIDEYVIRNGIENQVRYFGELSPGDQLNRFYNLGDAMIFLSKKEGFSLVVLEAMAAGLPVVIHENLQFNLADECYRYSDDMDFAEFIQNTVLKCGCLKGNQIRNHVVENYSWEKISMDYLRCFE